jgi:hypothetical protein
MAANDRICVSYFPRVVRAHAYPSRLRMQENVDATRVVHEITMKCCRFFYHDGKHVRQRSANFVGVVAAEDIIIQTYMI